MFQLHQDFANKIHITDLPLSRIILSPTLDFTWVILVPMVEGAKNILSLTDDEGIVFWREINIVARALNRLFSPDQLNIATLGNMTPQLHAHVITRFIGDAAWPNSPFGLDGAKLTDNAAAALVKKIHNEIANFA